MVTINMMSPRRGFDFFALNEWFCVFGGGHVLTVKRTYVPDFVDRYTRRKVQDREFIVT